MHTKDLAKALRAFAMITDFERSQELHHFAALVDRGRDETIAARVKRMTPSVQHPARLKETLEAVAVGLRAMGAIKPSATIHELLKLFAGRPGASVDDFCVAVCLLPPPLLGSMRRFKAANAAAANDICSKLARLVDDPGAFHAGLHAVAASSPAGTATWTLVANRLIGINRTYRDRKSAIRAICNHVEARAMGASTEFKREHIRPQ